MEIKITGYNDCPLWNVNEENECGLKCPNWYRLSRLGQVKHDSFHRRPSKCPAKEGVFIKLKNNQKQIRRVESKKTARRGGNAEE